MKWSRTYRWIEFSVSDYLMDAPESVMESLSRTIYTKIRDTEETFYPEDVCEWITSKEFRKAKAAEADALIKKLNEKEGV